MSAELDALKAATASLGTVVPEVSAKIDELMTKVAALVAVGGAIDPAELAAIQAQADAVNAAVGQLQAKVTAAVVA